MNGQPLLRTSIIGGDVWQWEQGALLQTAGMVSFWQFVLEDLERRRRHEPLLVQQLMMTGGMIRGGGGREGGNSNEEMTLRAVAGDRKYIIFSQLERNEGLAEALLRDPWHRGSSAARRRRTKK
jgi:hypothetical protein